MMMMMMTMMMMIEPEICFLRGQCPLDTNDDEDKLEICSLCGHQFILSAADQLLPDQLFAPSQTQC